MGRTSGIACGVPLPEEIKISSFVDVGVNVKAMSETDGLLQLPSGVLFPNPHNSSEISPWFLSMSSRGHNIVLKVRPLLRRCRTPQGYGPEQSTFLDFSLPITTI